MIPASNNRGTHLKLLCSQVLVYVNGFYSDCKISRMQQHSSCNASHSDYQCPGIQ